MANSIIKKTSSQYPKVYHGSGWLISGQNSPIKSYGTGTITLYETGVAKIDFVQTITTGDTSTSNFTWGIDSGFLNTFFGTTLPSITPYNLFSGVGTFYKSDGTVDAGSTQNGGTFQKVLTYWIPSRNYGTGGNRGGWPPSMFPVGSKIVGTCYGTFNI